MFIAKHGEMNHIFDGVELLSHSDIESHIDFIEQLKCPICGDRVLFNGPSSDNVFDYFQHVSDSPDCFAHNSSAEHRLAIEKTYKELHNRLHEVTGKKIEMDIERRIGSKANFVICDVLVRSPLEIIAEVFYKCSPLGLGRRLHTIYSNGYKLYLIFHTEGRHDVDRIERYLQRIAPLNVGRFNPESCNLYLGDLLDKKKLNLKKQNRRLLPNYIAR